MECARVLDSEDVISTDIDQCETGHHRCSENARCMNLPDSATEEESAFGLNYRCKCKNGFVGNGLKCKEEKEDTCQDGFGQKLKKILVSNIKQPTSFVGQSMAVMSMQTQVKFLQLNRMKYTGFIEFRRRQCGPAFLRAFLKDKVDISIVDMNNKKMSAKGALMYKVQGTKGFFVKDEAGNPDLSSAVVQFTKVFDNMKDALGDEWSKEDVEIGQSFNAEDLAKPIRDSFMMVVSSEVINKKTMGKFYDTCFDPSQVKFSIWAERAAEAGTKKLKTLRGDYTKCYVRNKMQKYLTGKCTEGGTLDESVENDFSTCTIEKN